MATRLRAAPQSWDARGYRHNAGFVSDLGAEILSWLNVARGEKILDLGCGDGTLGLKIAASGAHVVGVDASATMLAAASAAGLETRHCSGENLDYENQFDAVFSNAALHWMTGAQAVSDGVFRALKPGARFVAEMGGFGNVATIATALRAAAIIHGGDQALAFPWYFPTEAKHRACLETAGFLVERIELVPRPTELNTGIEGWLMTFRQPFVDQFPADRRAEVIATVVDLLRPSLDDGNGNWSADYVRLRFIARKPLL